jgi:hypothetical protein
MKAQLLLPSVLAWIICLAFLWSIALYLLAIFVRGRRQEAGLIYTFGGAILFVVTFSDRLRLAPLHLRTLLGYLPGATDATARFQSSVIALIFLAVLYALRILVFYQLIARPSTTREREHQTRAAREAINDLVAPSLAYYSLVVCIVALARGLYQLDPIATFATVAGLLLVYYLSILRYVIGQLSALADVAAVLIGRAWKYVKKIPIYVIVVLVTLESFRNKRLGSSNTALAQWAIARLDQLERELDDSDGDGDARLRRLAQRLNPATATPSDSGGE